MPEPGTGQALIDVPRGGSKALENKQVHPLTGTTVRNRCETSLARGYPEERQRQRPLGEIVQKFPFTAHHRPICYMHMHVGRGTHNSQCRAHRKLTRENVPTNGRGGGTILFGRAGAAGVCSNRSRGNSRGAHLGISVMWQLFQGWTVSIWIGKCHQTRTHAYDISHSFVD